MRTQQPLSSQLNFNSQSKEQSKDPQSFIQMLRLKKSEKESKENLSSVGYSS